MERSLLESRQLLSGLGNRGEVSNDSQGSRRCYHEVKKALAEYAYHLNMD